jgi:hypothetical protein
MRVMRCPASERRANQGEAETDAPGCRESKGLTSWPSARVESAVLPVSCTPRSGGAPEKGSSPGHKSAVFG